MRTVFKKYRNLINDKKTFQNILGHGPKVFNSEKIDPENIFEFVEGILDDISKKNTLYYIFFFYFFNIYIL